MLIKDKEKYQLLNFQRNLRNVSDIYRIFERNKISPILIKGLAASVNYPKPFQRNFSDIDLAVSPKEFDLSQKIIQENNFNVDLHCGLRHLDTVEWNDLYDNSGLIRFENIEFRVLRPEDHLRVLCVHWLTDGGADRTRLWDIYFLLQKNRDSFDWDRFLNVVSKKRRDWFLAVMSSAEKYLGLKLNKIDFENGEYKSFDWVYDEIEREWSEDVRLIPLSRSLGKNKNFFKQIKKRFPPNVLQAIVDTESELKKDSFFIIRAKDFLLRSKDIIKNFDKN